VRVAIYARVSTKDKGQDTANQLIQLRESTGRRVRTRRAAPSSTHVQGREPGKFDLVLFWALDRFTREGALETLQYLQRLTAAGVNWRSYTEAYLDSCGVFKDAVLAILAVIAKQGRIRLSERTTAGLERARKEGRVGGRRALACR
jgi:DNA invertase Pin-like site-specific DNA recombinase